MMSTPLHPAAEHTLDVGVRRAVALLHAGRPVEDAERVLMVAGAAAMLLDADRETLDP
jgi:hypothetical protein